MKLVRNIHQYTAIFEPDKKRGGFTVTIPSLPGCISEGDSFEQASANIQEAAELYLEVMGKNKSRAYAEEKGVVVAPILVRV